MLQTRGFSLLLSLHKFQNVLLVPWMMNQNHFISRFGNVIVFFPNVDNNVQAQIAELQKVLESFSSVENEVQALRSEKTALERDVELASATRQGSGGLLGWLSGGPRSP